MAPAPTATPLTTAQLTAQLEHERALSCSRLKATWENIFAKYGKNTDDEADIIDTRTGEIIVDNGHLRALPDEEEGGWGEVVGVKRKRGRSVEAGRVKRRRGEGGEEGACECDELEGTCPHKEDGEEGAEEEVELPEMMGEEKEEVEEVAKEVQEDVRASSPVLNGRSSPLATRERRRSMRTKSAASPGKPAPVEPTAPTVTETPAKTAKAAKTPKPTETAQKHPPQRTPKPTPKQTPKTPAVPEEDDDLDELSMSAPTPSRSSTMTPSLVLITPLRVRKNITDTPIPSRTRNATNPTPTAVTTKKTNAAPSTSTPAPRFARRASSTSTPTSADPLPSPPLPITTPTTARRRKDQAATSSPFHSPRSVTKTYKTPLRTTSSSRKPAPSDPWAPPPPEENPFYDPKWDDEHPDGRPAVFPPNPLLAELAAAPVYTPKRRKSEATPGKKGENGKGGGFLTPAPVKAKKEAVVERASRSVGASAKKKGKEAGKEMGKGVRGSARKEVQGSAKKGKGKMGPPPTPRRGLLDFLAEKEEKDRKKGDGEKGAWSVDSGGDASSEETSAAARKETAPEARGHEAGKHTAATESDAGKATAKQTKSLESDQGKPRAVEKGADESPVPAPVPTNAGSGPAITQGKEEPVQAQNEAPAVTESQPKVNNGVGGEITEQSTPEAATGNISESVKDSGYMPVIDAPQSAKKCGTHGYRCGKKFCFRCSGLDGEDDDLV